MIDITLYQQKLEYLKEWINARIDGTISPPIWVNMNALQFNYTIEQIMKIYQQTGIVYYREKDVVENPAIPITFDEYCKYKSKNQL